MKKREHISAPNPFALTASVFGKTNRAARTRVGSHNVMVCDTRHLYTASHTSPRVCSINRSPANAGIGQRVLAIAGPRPRVQGCTSQWGGLRTCERHAKARGTKRTGGEAPGVPGPAQPLSTRCRVAGGPESCLKVEERSSCPTDANADRLYGFAYFLQFQYSCVVGMWAGARVREASGAGGR